MKQSAKVMILGSVLAIGVVLSPMSYSHEDGPSVLANAVANAKTKVDHESLASNFENEAAARKRSVMEHRKMSQAYRALGPTKGSSAGFVSHCDKLIENEEEAAKDLLELAKLHRQLATEAAK